MRNAFHDELDGIGSTLLQMAGLVKVAMNDATSALLTVDLNNAEKVIAADDVIDDRAIGQKVLAKALARRVRVGHAQSGSSRYST